MYDSILLPVDGSEHAAKIVHHAAELAQWTEATIKVVFVADTTRDSVTVVDGTVVDALEQEGETIVADVAGTLETLGVEHGTDVVQGNPAPTIVDYAERYDYDLIVLPTHGRTGISRYLLGSVTEKVVRLSDVPVLTAQIRSGEQLTFPYENILIPTDGSPASTTAASHGLALAAALDATVHIISVVDDTSLGPDVRSGLSADELEHPASEAVVDVVAKAHEYELAHVQTHVEHGSPAKVIRESIETNEIHAIVMGTSGRRGADRVLLGSVAEKTVRSAPVPVITVREPIRNG
ncbi:universal stress protein [Halorarum halophilum]|uniref:Universal stress protein n=1 Tax=Halorarum halophilum TaxID=2743090 RepID=A0A7D5GYT8_9EURY|nr:universal stress protein [Halobaculum halophilum]QLG28949.1 universal stress protein [Halobaculum halophilum]